jgi:ribosome-binding factor A
MTRREERVGELLREEISDIILRQLKDPRLSGLISVTEVECSHDFRLAHVFISVLGSEAEQQSSLQALTAGAAFIRRELRARLKSLRYMPALVFRADTSIERGAQLADLLRQVAQDLPGEAATTPRPE